MGKSPRPEQLQEEIHVWICEPEAVTDAERLDYYASLLSTEERERQQRFRFNKDRHRFLVSHALVRRALSLYAAIEPSAWRFRANHYGRLEITEPELPLSLRFNLTHTNGLAACIVTFGIDCGIDAEYLSAPKNAAGIAQKMFAKKEQEALTHLRGPAFLNRFLTYWTLREAYCKALGLGLGRVTGNFYFDIRNDNTVRIRFSPDIHNETDDWQFALLNPTDKHIMAIAVHRPGQSDYNLMIRCMDP